MADAIPQSQQDLRQHLDDHIEFIKRSAQAYDAGFAGEAKRLATSIRVLVHDTAQSHSLLGQLGLKASSFLDTASPRDPNNLLTYSGLTAMAIRSSGASYVPLLSDTPGSNPRWLKFDEWWKQIVIVAKQGRTFRRRDIILSVADQDGGAHVDAELNEDYAMLARRNAMAWEFIGPDCKSSAP